MIKFWPKFLLSLALITFFFSLLILVNTGFGHNSPDEHAAFLFSEKVANYESLYFTENLNLKYEGLIHPRSTLALGEKIIPIAFLGLPMIYGSIASIFGNFTLYLLTPFFFIFSALALFHLAQAYFKNEKIAFITAIIYLIHPAMWFYAGRGLMHNILFNSFIIFSAYFLWLQPWKKHQWLNPIFSGISLAFALQTRLFEIFWLIPLFIIATLIILPKKTWLKNSIFLIFSAFIISLPFLTLQNNLYGDFWRTGYNPAPFEYQIEKQKLPSTENQNSEPNSEPNSESNLSELTSESTISTSSILPFGFAPRLALQNTWNYLILLFPWFSLLSLFGLLFWLNEKENLNKNLKFLFLSLIISAYLLIVYGSWLIHDNPDPRAITIANSYIRYWIPLFTLSTFLISTAIYKIAHFTKKPNLVITFLLLITLSFSIPSVFFGDDGLLKTRQNLLSYSEDKNIILENTTENSIIIVDFADKYLYPHRSVIVPLRSQRTYDSLPELLKNEEIYYFGITLPQTDLDFFNSTHLENTDFELLPLISIREKTLYHFSNQ